MECKEQSQIKQRMSSKTEMRALWHLEYISNNTVQTGTAKLDAS